MSEILLKAQTAEVAKYFDHMLANGAMATAQTTHLIPLFEEGRAISITEREYVGSGSFALLVYNDTQPATLVKACVGGQWWNGDLESVEFTHRGDPMVLAMLCDMIKESLDHYE
ncbi:MAG: hypothetical protein JWN38_852 [Candidatus Saccharibacteria bacterium]|nr:hypothetical protein [Candidatus Saccharibacteria bacterium]